MKNKYTLAVLASGCLWGTMGIFRRTLESMEVSTAGVIAVRCLCASVMFAAVMLIKDKSMFCVKSGDLWIFAGAGIVSLFLFGYCYFRAMQLMSLSTAAILLYTAPCFVIIFSAILFGERLDAKKLVAMLIAFLGCCFVSGIGSGGGGLTLKAFMLGIGSGICYALYSIFTRFAINKGYSTLALNLYACIFAGVAGALVDGGSFAGICFTSGSGVLASVLTGGITCFLPYLLYTYGLTGLENGRASIMASIEPVVATLVGFLVYHETLSALNGLGVLLVLSAIVLLNTEIKKTRS